MSLVRYYHFGISPVNCSDSVVERHEVIWRLHASLFSLFSDLGRLLAGEVAGFNVLGTWSDCE